MGVVVESSVWEPNPALYIFIFISCFVSICFFPYASGNSSNKTPTLFDHGVSPSFRRFQRNFLFLYSLASDILLKSVDRLVEFNNVIEVIVMQGHRQDSISDTFWLMTLFESASAVGSQVLANWLVGDNMEKNISSTSTAAILLAMMSIVCFNGGLTGTAQTSAIRGYRASFSVYILGDKRVWLLAWAQACLHFSISVFWIMWAPTLVADGREVHLGLIYPCLLGAKMLGSTVFPWLISGPSSLRTEDILAYSFIVLGLVLSLIAYDYQDIGVLVTLFCLFHGCVGLILPSLARLRTMYVPNELRGGMISLSLAPANAAILLLMIYGGYYWNIGNAVIMAFAALGLLTAAGCASSEAGESGEYKPEHGAY
ncbi:hypothetical protein CJ030_MR5G016626 [Morella rubra]|uniref:Uncharacterized protein n=1 Tax=Morella rubra TaxID=262757 RepID=A0A6A1VS63_9ROSI|nr:hypothetical protein CJ030_MR5G016626 [Morella rubra]